MKLNTLGKHLISAFSIAVIFCGSCSKQGNKNSETTQDVVTSNTILNDEVDSLIYATAVITDGVATNANNKEEQVADKLMWYLDKEDYEAKLPDIVAEVADAYHNGTPLVMSYEDAHKYLSAVSELGAIQLQLDIMSTIKENLKDSELTKYFNEEEGLLLSQAESLVSLYESNPKIASFKPSQLENILKYKEGHGTDVATGNTNWHFSYGADDEYVLENIVETGSGNTLWVTMGPDGIKIIPMERKINKEIANKVNYQPEKVKISIGDLEASEYGEEYSFSTLSQDKIDYLVDLFEKGNFTISFTGQDGENESMEIGNQLNGAKRAYSMVKKIPSKEESFISQLEHYRYEPIRDRIIRKMKGIK